MTIPFLAIDFGATHTRAAFRDSRGVDHVLELAAKSKAMRSAVFADRDVVHVGDSAVRRAAARPDAFEAHPKLRIAEESVLLAGRDYPTTTLVAAIFRHVLVTLRRPAEHFVISYPDVWGQLQRSRMIEAATLAGIDTGATTLITESQAAAVNYTTGARQEPLPRVCTIDFGGRTVDAAVLDLKPSGAYRVTASGALPQLGGRDLDGQIFTWVIEQLRRRNSPALRGLDDIGTQLTLMAEIERAKNSLSSASRAQITVGDDTLQLTRTQFEQMIHDDVARSVDLAKRVIDTAQQSNPAPIQRVFLSGSGAGIPLIHREIAQLGTLAPLDEPGEAVVRGCLAAIGGGPGKSKTSISMVYSREDFQIPEPPSKPENRHQHRSHNSHGQRGTGWLGSGSRTPDRPPVSSGWRADQWQSGMRHADVRQVDVRQVDVRQAEPDPRGGYGSGAIPQPPDAQSGAVPLTGAQVFVPGPPSDARPGSTWGPIEIRVGMATSVRPGDVLAVTSIDGLAVELVSPVSGIIRVAGASGYLFPGAPLVTIAPKGVPGDSLRALQYLPASARLAGPPPSSGYRRR